MARIRVDQLKATLGSDTANACTKVSLQQAIGDANAWIDNFLIPSCPALQPGGANEDKLPIIERYLAAHFATLNVEGTQLTSARRQDIAESYAELSESMGSTRFINNAAAFDPCGIIRDRFIEPRRKARFRVGPGYAPTTGSKP